MLQRLLARWRLWEQALEGMDDPRGDFLLQFGGTGLPIGRRRGEFAQASLDRCGCGTDAGERPGDQMTGGGIWTGPGVSHVGALTTVTQR